MLNKQGRDGQRVWFQQWVEVLDQAVIDQKERLSYRNWIIRYLKHCKDNREAV